MDTDMRVLLVDRHSARLSTLRAVIEQAGFEVITAPMGYLSAGYARPMGGWLPESRVISQSSQLLNEAIGLFAYPLAHGRD
mgnify:CR=1 FL=1